jgi:hypothetical protein
MFDNLRNSPSTVTTASDIVVTLNPLKRFNSIALLQMTGVQSIDISVARNSSPTVVYSATIFLEQDFTGWYDYFFGTLVYKNAYILFDLPPYIDLKPTITFHCAVGGGVGAIVLGKYTYIGDVQNNPSISAQNYSTITRDTFGNSTLIVRRNVPKTSQTLFVSPQFVDGIKQIRTDLNAIPAVWSGMEADSTNANFNSLLIMGFYTNLNIVADSSIGATIELELEEI